MLKYLPKDYDLFSQNDIGSICFEEISQEFTEFDLFIIKNFHIVRKQ